MRTERGKQALLQAQGHRRAGDFAAARDVLEAPAALAREQGPVGEAIELTLWESLSLGGVGEYPLALARATWCISAALAPENRAALEPDAFSVTMAFLLFVNHGEREDAIPFERLLDVCDQAEAFVIGIGKPEWRSGVLSERAGVLSRMGRHEDAASALSEAWAMKRRHPNAPGHTVRTMGAKLGRELAACGRHDDAARVFESMLEEPGQHPLDRLAVLTYAARSALEAGRIESAAAYADEACRTCDGLGPNQVIAAHGVAVEVYVAAGRLDEAQRSAERVREQSEILGTTQARYGAHEDLARVALARGDGDAFEHHVAAAAPLAAAIDARAGHPELAERLGDLRAQWEARA